jgi:hypothetical protein
MSFFKNLFDKKESDSDTLKQDNRPEYAISTLKVMKEIDIITEAVLAAEDIYTNKGYEVYHVQELATELPQLQLMKNENKILVYIDYSRKREGMDDIFDKDKISNFIKHAAENSSDCLVVIVNIDDPKNQKELYFGESYSYSITEQFYPILL